MAGKPQPPDRRRRRHTRRSWWPLSGFSTIRDLAVFTTGVVLIGWGLYHSPPRVDLVVPGVTLLGLPVATGADERRRRK
ncbi:hypothetical protein [Actinocorallia aurea]